MRSQLSQTRNGARVAVVALILVALAGPWAVGVARANGLPTVVLLSYIEGLSTWGPQDARGEVEISFSEGYARIEATGMPALNGDTVYQGWIVNSESNEGVSVGRFNAGADGSISFEGLLPEIEQFGFDLFIITVEPNPDTAPQPTSDRAIGGYFSLVGPSPNESTLEADTLQTPSVQTPSVQTPSELPATGDPALATDIARISLIAAAIAVSLIFAVQVARRRSQEHGE